MGWGKGDGGGAEQEAQLGGPGDHALQRYRGSQLSQPCGTDYLWNLPTYDISAKRCGGPNRLGVASCRAPLAAARPPTATDDSTTHVTSTYRSPPPAAPSACWAWTS